MFVCDLCHKVVSPRIKPIMVPGASRQTSYSNEVFDHESEKTFTKVSSGSELVAEYKVCGACVGLEVKPEAKVDHKPIINIVHGMQAYARKSNKKIEDDRVMQANLEYYKSFPPQSMSLALEDPKVAPAKWKLAYTLMENTLAKAFEAEKGSKRAKADFEAGFSLLKAYELRSGSL